MPMSTEQAKDAWPHDHHLIDQQIHSSKQRGCTCTPWWETRAEVMATWDQRTPQQRAVIMGALNPECMFLEHDVRCELHRMSMAPYN